MERAIERWVHPALKELVLEASRALARLDADRLEALALCCQALNRDLPSDLSASLPAGRQIRTALALQANEVTGDMATFARILEVTRANLRVMERLRQAHNDRLEYSAPGQWALPPAKDRHGDN